MDIDKLDRKVEALYELVVSIKNLCKTLSNELDDQQRELNELSRGIEKLIGHIKICCGKDLNEIHDDPMDNKN